MLLAKLYKILCVSFSHITHLDNWLKKIIYYLNFTILVEILIIKKIVKNKHTWQENWKNGGEIIEWVY